MIETFLEYIRKRKAVDFGSVSTIFDLGSGDCAQACELADAFPNAQVYAFECNPRLIERCRRKAATHPRVTLVERAVWHESGTVSFHPNNPEKTTSCHPEGNQYASSMYLANGTYPYETYVQDTVEVEAVRLDTWMLAVGVERVDIIWADLQGAALPALVGMGRHVWDIRAIHIELERIPIWAGQSLYAEVDRYLRMHRLQEVHSELWSEFSGDYIYVREAP